MLSGQKLQFLRIYKRISQSDLAKKLKVTPSYISILENEKQEIPEYFYQKWVDALNGRNEKEIDSVVDEVKEVVKETEKEIKKESKGRKKK